jgi:YggT family protein
MAGQVRHRHAVAVGWRQKHIHRVEDRVHLVQEQGPGRLDTATVMVAFIIEYLLLLLLLALRGASANFLSLATTALFELAILSLNLMFFVVLIKIILSWVAPDNYNPIVALLNSIAEPILRPFRRLIPPIGGLDISPIFAIVLLQAGVIILQSYKPLPV